MPSVTYMNQSAPFWDFIASLEQDGRNHPFFSRSQNDNNERGEEQHHGPPPFGPGGWGFPFWGQDMPHRGPPPPPGPPPHEYHAEEHNEETEKDHDKDKENDNGEGPSNAGGSDNEGCARGRGRHGRCGGRRGRHGWGPYGRGGFVPHHGPPHGPPHGPHHHGRRGGWGPWGGRGGGSFNPFDFAAGLFDPSNFSNDKDDNETEDFVPEADIFDTPTSSSFIIHVSLPGAKKEDVGVNWDAAKSELSIAGVIYRPGDENLLKTLSMGERKVGPFERKIRLGTRANPAQIDAEGISAKLEDGVLRIEVPKLEQEGFVEVRKVDIE